MEKKEERRLQKEERRLQKEEKARERQKLRLARESRGNYTINLVLYYC